MIAFLRLSHVVLKELMEFAEIDCKVTSAFGCQVPFRMNGKVRMVTLVRVERRDTSQVTWSVVVGKLGDGKERRPVTAKEPVFYLGKRLG